jgi:hypothetical protein
MIRERLLHNFKIRPLRKFFRQDPVIITTHEQRVYRNENMPTPPIRLIPTAPVFGIFSETKPSMVGQK